MKKTLVSLATVTALTGITGVTAQTASADEYTDGNEYTDYWYTTEGGYTDYSYTNDYSYTSTNYEQNTVAPAEEESQAPAPTATTNDSNAASVAHSVASGKSYVYGGNSATAVDCSALTQQFMKEYKGIDIPRTVSGQQAAGTQVSDPQPGDLVFFNGGTHVGIYIGNGQMVDALNPSEHVGERSVNYVSGSVDGYYRY